MPVDRRLRDQPIGPDEVHEALTREVVPVLRQTREVLNAIVGDPLSVVVDDGAIAVNWRARRTHTLLLTEDVTEVVFEDPEDVGDCVLLVQQEKDYAVGGWPDNVAWFGGTAPTITTSGGSVDLIRFFWDGLMYYAKADQNAT